LIGAWFGVSKALLTIYLSQGRDALITDVPPRVIDVLRNTAADRNDSLARSVDLLFGSLVIDTQDITPDQAAHKILVKLESMGFIK